MDKFSFNIPVRVGLVAYVAVVMLGLMSYFFYKAMFMSMFLAGMMSVFYIGMVLMLAIWSGIAYRSNNYNVISFSHAFVAVYIVFAFCSVGNVFSTLLVNKLIDKDFPQKIYTIRVEKAKGEMKMMNKTAEQQKEELDQIRIEDPSYADMAKNLGLMLAGTAVFSLLVAMFIKRSSEDLIRMNEKNTIQG
ncbi:MAG: hypothetical protein JWO03_2803 [Bacteroidetes bacterium]|nr:hypothetical protein [Bacteroidota bacterium]